MIEIQSISSQHLSQPRQQLLQQSSQPYMQLSQQDDSFTFSTFFWFSFGITCNWYTGSLTSNLGSSGNYFSSTDCGVGIFGGWYVWLS